MCNMACAIYAPIFANYLTPDTPYPTKVGVRFVYISLALSTDPTRGTIELENMENTPDLRCLVHRT